METNTPFEYDGHILDPSKVVETLAPYLTDNRKKRIKTVIGNRTNTIVPVLDGIYDRGNTSAVMRSAESFGLQKMHLIETQEKFKAAKSVSNGADKWLDIMKWKEPTACAEYLKANGYQIVSTHLEASVPISEIDFTKPTAIVFGNEKDGVSRELLEMSDARIIIPMQGFSQSFNISVAAAISFYHIWSERVRKLGHHGDLSNRDKKIIEAKYYLNSVDNPMRFLQ